MRRAAFGGPWSPASGSTAPACGAARGSGDSSQLLLRLLRRLSAANDARFGAFPGHPVQIALSVVLLSALLGDGSPSAALSACRRVHQSLRPFVAEIVDGRISRRAGSGGRIGCLCLAQRFGFRGAWRRVFAAAAAWVVVLARCCFLAKRFRFSMIVREISKAGCLRRRCVFRERRGVFHTLWSAGKPREARDDGQARSGCEALGALVLPGCGPVADGAAGCRHESCATSTR